MVELVLEAGLVVLQRSYIDGVVDRVVRCRLQVVCWGDDGLVEASHQAAEILQIILWKQVRRCGGHTDLRLWDRWGDDLGGVG